jgi:hypothetical protein
MSKFFFCVLDSTLEVGLNSRCLLNRLFKEGDISQHKKELFYQAPRVFYETAYKYALANQPHSDDLLKSAEVINWEERKEANIDGITYFVKRYKIQATVCTASM